MQKNIHTEKRAAPEKGSFRRWVRQLFTSWIKRQNDEADEVLTLLQDIKDSVEIMAREMARQSKRRK